MNELLVNETKACDTSIRLYRLPPTFTLSLQLKMLIKANYNQQMYGTSHGTIIVRSDYLC